MPLWLNYTQSVYATGGYNFHSGKLSVSDFGWVCVMGAMEGLWDTG